jgi:hypothetical protein
VSEQVANLIVRLGSDQATFDRDIKKAQSTLKNYAASAKNAEAANDALAGGFSRAANGASVLYGPLNGVSGRLSSMASMLGKVGVGWLGVGTAVSAFTAGLAYGTKTFAETETRLLKQEQLLKATGNASGFTTTQLDKMARSIALNTLASTDGVAQAQSIMLTFKSVTGDTFQTAMKLSQDMASVMGSDIKSAAMQLGKALEMPSEGLNALKRSGVSFSQSQKELIKDLESTGRVADAQRVVLKTLEDQLGGSGEAEAKGMTGTVDTLGQKWEELWEHMADRTGAASATGSALSGLVRILDQLDKKLFPEKEDIFTKLSNERYNLKMTITSRLQGRDPESLPEKASYGPMYSQELYQQDQSRLNRLTEQLKSMQDDRKQQSIAEGEAQRKSAEAEKQRLAEANAERERSAKDEAAKESKRFAERQAAALKAKQQQGSSQAFNLDKTYGDDVSDMKLEHQRRLDEIQSMVLSEEEIRRRGFENIEALRQEFSDRESAYFETQKEDYKQKLIDKLSSDLDVERDANTAKAELDQEKYAKTQELIQSYWDKGLINEQEKTALSTKNLTKYKSTIDSLQKAAMQNVVSFSSQQMGVMTDMLSDAGKEHTGLYKLLFAAQKAAAIPSMIVSTEQAATDALAAFPGPAGLAMSNVVRGLGYASIGVVTGQALAGMAHDGIDNIPTEGTWLLQKNERVVDSRTNSDLKQYLASSSGNHSSSGGMVVNLIEDASRAGTVDQSSDGDITTLDIRVAKLLQSSSSNTAQVMKSRYRNQQYGN